jgi:hypothetical protein
MMKIDTIEFNSEYDRIVITLVDGQILVFTKENIEQYLNSFPDRAADLVAMGWQQKEQA